MTRRLLGLRWPGRRATPEPVSPPIPEPDPVRAVTGAVDAGDDRRRQAALLAGVLNSISDGVLVVDGAGEFLLINPAARYILDTDAVPATPDQWQESFGIFAADGVTPVPPEHMPLVRALAGEAPEQDDYVFRNARNPDGARVTASARALDPAAGVAGGGAVAVIRDVTAARLLQEEVHAQRDRYERLLSVLSDLGEGVAVMEGTRFFFVNDAYAELTGYSVNELLAMDRGAVAADAAAMQDFADIRQQLGDAERAGLPSRAPVRLTRVRHRDGHIVPIETMGMNVDDGGTVRHFYVVRDLTEQHRTQAELARQAADLLVANEKLAAARDVADAASRAKSAFLATMSHEIRTPLNAVIGFTDLLLDTALDTDQREYLEAVRTGGNNLIALISDILDWTKIESGALDLEHQPFGLRDCVEGAVDLLAAAVGEKDVDLLVEIEPECPAVVVGDLVRLRQILVNLVGNAVKFTDRGHVLVTAQAPVEPAGPDTVGLRFVVADTGIGIAPDKLDRLFRDFTQVDDSTTRVYGGTGLGLAISRRLAEAMGGTISVSSEPGRGSVFTLDVRLALASANDVPAAAGIPGVLPGRRVLVVDDNAVNRRILAAQLGGWGMRVDPVSSGAAALEMLAALPDGERFDVALFDFHMPGMDGLMLLDRVAAVPAVAGLPVIMLTSVANRVTVMSAPHAPARHLTKPVHAAELRDSLATVLGAPAAAGPAAAPVAAAADLAGTSPLQVLVVEDSGVNRTVVQLMLDRLGHAADLAGDGAEAVAAARRTPYDVILMDVQMPVLNGLDATRRLRDVPPAGPRPWVIALTANALAEDREQCAAAGMDDYLSKPVRREELAEALARVPAVARS